MAPRLIAVTASLTPPNPVITTARIIGKSVSASSRRSMSIGVGQAEVDHQRVVRKTAQPIAAVGGIRGLCHREPVGLETVSDNLAKRGIIFDEENGIRNGVSHVPGGTVRHCGNAATRPPAAFRRRELASVYDPGAVDDDGKATLIFLLLLGSATGQL